eukprot:PhF_6_TR29254/c0_g1_i4/m.42830
MVPKLSRRRARRSSRPITRSRPEPSKWRVRFEVVDFKIGQRFREGVVEILVFLVLVLCVFAVAVVVVVVFVVVVVLGFFDFGVGVGVGSCLAARSWRHLSYGIKHTIKYRNCKLQRVRGGLCVCDFAWRRGFV